MNSLSGVTVVGLTGQTGAGKTTISKIFSENGFTIIDADKVARKVVEKGSNCLYEIEELFGREILNDDETLDRKALAAIVFTDKAKLETLNTIMHPYITKEILSMIKENSNNGVRLILLDAPTLFESHADDFCEIIISVLADENVREQRIIARDGITHEQARQRMDSQYSDEFFMSHSDYIIRNDGDIETVTKISREVSDKIKDCYLSNDADIITNSAKAAVAE
ncbi:MAG: dephospho-CoA kinase [Ruminococcus sp.]|nr:dephospho-CoA kinase [Ruminococcus sp.]HRR75309.1 dephospho-CoA kinase [Ruminococcus sp.]